MGAGLPILNISVIVRSVVELMPNTSLTRQLTIVIYKHPWIGKMIAPIHRLIYQRLPTAHYRLMSGTDADAKNVRKQND